MFLARSASRATPLAAICAMLMALPAAVSAQTPPGNLVAAGAISNANSNLCLDVARAAADDGLNVQLGACGSPTAHWDLADLGGGEYALVNRLTRRVLDVAGGAFHDGANVQQYSWNNSGAQRWRLESLPHVASGVVQIVNQRSGKCLDVSDRGNTAGANIHQWQCHGMENQQWRLSRAATQAIRSGITPATTPIAVLGERPHAAPPPLHGVKPYSGGGQAMPTATPRVDGRLLHSGMIISRASGKCMDVEGAKKDDGVNIRQWACNGTDAQLWDFFDLGRGELAVVARASGKVMDLVGASRQNGANIAQYTWHSGDNQRWRMETAGRGFFKLVSVASGKCVDVDETDGGKHDGANIHQWQCHGNENQQWRVEISGVGAGWNQSPPPSGSTLPNARFSDAPPAALVGSWEGVNPIHQSRIRLTIYADGTAQAIVHDDLRVNGYYRNQQLYLGAERYDIQPERHGMRTSQVGQPNNVVHYSRVR